MRSVGTEAGVYLYTGVVDMRVGFDRLAAKICEEVGRRVHDGGYYVFFSKYRDRVRIFYWDRDGYAMWTKRLEAGSFKVERGGEYEVVTAVDLEAILGGMELSRIKLRRDVERSLYS